MKVSVNESTLVKEFTCDICKKQLSSKQSHSQHLNIHSGSKPFICGYSGCTAEFSHASKLSIHKQIHEPKQVHLIPSFDSFKDFIFLVLQAFEVSKKKQFKLKISTIRITLPPISKPCFEVVLPLPKALRT